MNILAETEIIHNDNYFKILKCFMGRSNSLHEYIDTEIYLTLVKAKLTSVKFTLQV